MSEVYNKMKAVKFFTGKLENNSAGDTVISGLYQNQMISVIKEKQSFAVHLTFGNKKSYDRFLKAGQMFFSQYTFNGGYLNNPNGYCNEHNFRKPDLKDADLNISFYECSAEAKMATKFSLTFTTLQILRCGNE